MIAANAGPLCELLVIGTALRALAAGPKALQWSQGRTNAILWTNVVAVAAIVPSMSYFAMRFGAFGGAVSFLGVNATLLAAILSLTHRRDEAGDFRIWSTQDVLPPLLASLAIVLCWRALAPSSCSSLCEATYLGGAFSTTCLGAAIAVPTGRMILVRAIRLGPVKSGYRARQAPVAESDQV